MNGIFISINEEDRIFLKKYPIKTHKLLLDVSNGSFVDGNELSELLCGVFEPHIKAKRLSPKNVKMNLNKLVDNFLIEYAWNNIQQFHDTICSPPLIFENYLNKKTNINEICKEFNIPNINKFFVNFKFISNPTSGTFEAFMILMFKNVVNSNKGDAAYMKNATEKHIEIKGKAARLKGQKGYHNGMASYLNSFFKNKKIEPPKNELDYNINRNDKLLYDLYEEQTKLHKKLDLQEIENKETFKIKKLNFDKANKGTKNYINTERAYNNFKTNPTKIKSIKNKISKNEKEIESRFLERYSVKIGKEQMIQDFLTIFSHKYKESHKEDIIEFLEKGIKNNGYFSDNFLKEWLIFEFKYYQQIEAFSYFVITDEIDFMIFDSINKIMEAVNNETIQIKSTPSFGSKAGTQGEVFSINLN